MFKLSQKADYGLILLSSFAAHDAKAMRAKKASEDKSSSYLPIANVAEDNQIPPKFLSQIATELKKAGILTSKEGKNGGYKLGKSADKIKILDVLSVLDGELVEGKCFEEGHECVCGAGEMWEEVRDQLAVTMGNKTVADLVV
jgi:Rrf2 family protein